MKPTLFMMIGLPGSGKSTYANSLGFKVVSSDSIRKELYGDENIQGDSNKVFRLVEKRIKEELLNNEYVAYDTCNVHMKYRKAFLDNLKIDCCKFAVVMNTPYQECLERNKNRERVVPEEVISRMYHSFQYPYYFEGFDMIIRTNEIPLRLLKTEMYMDFDQKNSHHSLTLGEHMDEAFKYVINKYCDEIFNDPYNTDAAIAAKYHDIGKALCQTFDENGQAHYYGHENIGAYESMFHINGNHMVSALITYHMMPYTWHEEKTREKYKKLFGEKFYNALMILHEADVAAH